MTAEISTADIGAVPRAHTAVVTGAASGMGLATTRLLAASGWRVLAIDIAHPSNGGGGASETASTTHTSEPAAAAPPASALGEATSTVPGCVIPLPADITDRAALETALGEEPAIDLVANIAGIYPPSTLETFTEDLYRRTFDVNVLGTLNVVAAARPRMPRGASVVNFASVDAFTVSPGQLLYGASKAAVVMLTKELALELAPAGIRVNAIAPGWVETPGNAATGRMHLAAASIPLGRVAQPQEIARWVELLAGDEASFMTGETVVLSGGDVIR